jgi:hypothetical protein
MCSFEQESYRHPCKVECEVDGVQNQGTCLLSKTSLCPDHEGSQTQKHVQKAPVRNQGIDLLSHRKIANNKAAGMSSRVGQGMGRSGAYHVGPKTGVGRFHEGFLSVLYLSITRDSHLQR